jgi:hypothetical protein
VIDSIGEPSANLNRSENSPLKSAYSVRDPLLCRVGFELSTLDGSPIFEVYDVDEDTNTRQPNSR